MLNESMEAEPDQELAPMKEDSTMKVADPKTNNDFEIVDEGKEDEIVDQTLDEVNDDGTF